MADIRDKTADAQRQYVFSKEKVRSLSGSQTVISCSPWIQIVY